MSLILGHYAEKSSNTGLFTRPYDWAKSISGQARCTEPWLRLTGQNPVDRCGKHLRHDSPPAPAAPPVGQSQVGVNTRALLHPRSTGSSACQLPHLSNSMARLTIREVSLLKAPVCTILMPFACKRGAACASHTVAPVSRTWRSDLQIQSSSIFTGFEK